MALAILNSPSGYSPPTSPDSDRSSPRLPELSSPFERSLSLTKTTAANWDDDDHRDNLQFSTPTKATADASSYATPNWVTEELEEEWVEEEQEEEEAGDADGDDNNNENNRSWTTSHTTTPSPKLPPNSGSVVYSSLNKPRVPSSLRHAFTLSTSSTATDQEPETENEHEESQASSVGTCVMKGSIQIREDVVGQEASQLQAAVRALRGPSSGLGALLPGEEEATDGVAVVVKKKNVDKLGLMRLFDPPSPPAPLPPSQIPAPSTPTFSFSPPPLVRTSWRSTTKFSPSAVSDNNTTPLARAPLPAESTPLLEAENTPVGLNYEIEKAPAPRQRYLRSNVAPTTTSGEPDSHSGFELNDLEDEDGGLPLPTTPAPAADDGAHDYFSSPRSHSGLPLHYPTTPLQPTSSTSSTTSTPALRIFEFQYDTFTRHHLAALVDEIDDLGSPNSRERSRSSGGDEAEREEGDAEWEESFVEPKTHGNGKPGRGHDEEDDEGDVSEDSAAAGRSSKRIRLSPPPEIRESEGIELGSGSRTGRSREMRRWSRRSSNSAGKGRGSLERRNGNRSEALVRRRLETEFSPSRSRAASRNSTRTSLTDRTTAQPETTNEDSMAFARSLDGSTKKVNLVETSTKEDRIGAANALLEKIRARNLVKEALKESQTSSSAQRLDVPISNHISLSSRISKTKDVSPRKVLRRLSASDEIDEELRTMTLDPSESPSLLPASAEVGSNDEQPLLPHLAAAAQATLRDVLRESSTTTSSTSSQTPRNQPSSAPRRQFARTPVASVHALRKSRGRVDGIFPPTSSTPTATPNSASSETTPVAVVKPTSLHPIETSTPPPPPPQGHARHRSFTTIGPTDVEAILASTSAPHRMVFDPQQSKWIKERSVSKSRIVGMLESIGQTRERGVDADDSGSTEDDPFRDLEASPLLGGGSRSVQAGRSDENGLAGLGISQGTPMPPVVVVSPPEANRFGTTLPGHEDEGKGDETDDETQDVELQEIGTRWGPTEGLTSEEEETETEEEREDGAVTETEATDTEESPFKLFNAINAAHQQPPPTLPRQPSIAHSTVATNSPPRRPTPIRPFLPITPQPQLQPQSQSSPSLSGTATPVAIPRSALKPTVRSQSDPGHSTPNQNSYLSEPKAPRSVSFSDGKDSGKIDTMMERERRLREGNGEWKGSRLKFQVSTSQQSFDMDDYGIEVGQPGSLELVVPPETMSFGGQGNEGENQTATLMRTRNIESALQDLEQSGPQFSTASPSEQHHSRNSVVVGSFESAPPVRARSQSRTFRRTTAADATFLTECSFGVSHDRLVQVITDVEPFEPDWEGLTSIDLSKKGIESLVKLKDFLPKLDEGNFNDNEITFLTGLPATIRTLLISSNRISSLTSFSHLRNLERIDISNNNIGSFHELSCLVHLRELKADNNQIRDLGSLAGLDGLLRLSLRGNQIENVDFSTTKWTRLEMLDLSRNKVATVTHLERLSKLTCLNLDHNKLILIEPAAPLPRLRVLRICNNPIESFDVSFAPKLRTLFIDGGRLTGVEGTDRLRKLENLSIRDQAAGSLTLPMRDIRDVKRLYLSGNPIPTAFPSEKFFNLVYLELAMCQIDQLPSNLASLIPNVRVLNLNFNFIEDLSPLAGLTRLTKLTILGARLDKCRPIAAVLGTMSELESIDLRMNPLTLAFYPPLILQQNAEIAPHSDYQILHPHDDRPGAPSSQQWTAIDRKFRKALPDAWYYKRMTYRAVIMQTVPTLVSLDGVECVKERSRMAKNSLVELLNGGISA